MKPFAFPLNATHFLPRPEVMAASLSTAGALELRSVLVALKNVSGFSFPAKDSVKSVTLESLTGDIIVLFNFSAGIPSRIAQAAIAYAPASFIEKLDLLLFRKLRTSNALPAAKSTAVKETEPVKPVPTSTTTPSDISIRIPSAAVKDRLIELFDGGLLDPKSTKWECAKILHEGKKITDNCQLKASGFTINVTEAGCTLGIPDAFFTKNVSRILAGFSPKTLLALESKAGSALYK